MHEDFSCAVLFWTEMLVVSSLERGVRNKFPLFFRCSINAITEQCALKFRPHELEMESPSGQLGNHSFSTGSGCAALRVTHIEVGPTTFPGQVRIDPEKMIDVWVETK
jgi:hypothetical protein